MKSLDDPRLENILKMQMYISKGNFKYRIPRSEKDDIIESIIVMTNMIVEEMRETLSAYSDLQTNNSISQHMHMVFILSENLEIVYVSADVLSELGYASNDLLNKPFASLLAHNHINLWQSISPLIFKSKEYNKQHRLMFQNKDGMERSYSCVLTSIYDISSTSQYLMVSIYEPFTQSKILEEEFRKTILKSDSIQDQKHSSNIKINAKDRKTMREIHHFLLRNLDKPFPGLRVLANQFGTNECKLKSEFRQLYGNSVGRFFKEERLIKASHLLKDTELPIKIIAEMCGYFRSSHFSKDFKWRYGVSPRSMRKGRKL